MQLHQSGHVVLVLTTGQSAARDVPNMDAGGSSQPTVVSSRLSLDVLPGVHADAGKAYPPPFPDPLLMRSIRHHLKVFQPDIVHAHGWSEVSARHVLTDSPIPLVVTLHDYGLLCPARDLMRDSRTCTFSAGTACVRCPRSAPAILKRSALAAAIRLSRPCRRADVRYIAVSSHVAERHLAEMPFLDISVVPNFVDLSAWPSEPLPAGPSLLFVGPTSMQKGYHIVVAAHGRLRTAGWGDLILDHVGDANDSSDGAVTSWGRLSGAALRARFAAASMVVVPPLWEDPCPTVALEAMASGRAVVASRIGGLKEIVSDRITGLLFAAGDVADLVSALLTLLEDPQLTRRMGESARQAAIGFSSEVVVPQIEAVYDETMRTRAR